ncbi:MAG: DUF3667 domain-containing protein [Bacteroidia bacterium]|nr:DUF3667 domain-containing protein [Bacteroidia bacterium]
MNLRKISRTDRCLNCETPLNKEKDNFCPACGQLNNTKKETAIGLVRELVEEFLHLDSKVMRSLVPLLTRPGFLTLDYNQGRRARYFHPVRLFLTVTVIMFIITGFSGASERGLNDGKEKVRSGSGRDESKMDSVLVFDTESGRFERIADSSDGKSTLNFNWSFGKAKVYPDSLQRFLDQGIRDPGALMDTFKIEKTFVNTFLFRQILKKQEEGYQHIGDYYKHKLPWILFSLMPVFAFVLFLFYIRSGHYFVDHLIHAFHLHSAAFIIIALEALLAVLLKRDVDFLLLTIPLYYFLSLKRVYAQSWGKTIFKGAFIGVVYCILGISSVGLISLLLFFLV